MNLTNQETENRLKRMLGQMAGSEPEATVIIPVNAREDLQKVMAILDDISHYHGRHCLELLLVINNYPADSPPPEIEDFRVLGLEVVAAPSVRRPGEVVIMSARALGVQAAHMEPTIHFDADCRLVNTTALLDWYVECFQRGTQLAYTYVGFYGLKANCPVRLKIAAHHRMRWIKRNLFGIPTTRGGNYAVSRSLFLQLYESGRLSVDMQLGPLVKLAGGSVTYSGQHPLKVLTSGRRHKGSWRRLAPYFLHRLQYNLHAIPTRSRAVTRESWNGFDLETERRLRASRMENSLTASSTNNTPGDGTTAGGAQS